VKKRKKKNIVTFCGPFVMGVRGRAPRRTQQKKKTRSRALVAFRKGWKRLNARFQRLRALPLPPLLGACSTPRQPGKRRGERLSSAASTVYKPGLTISGAWGTGRRTAAREVTVRNHREFPVGAHESEPDKSVGPNADNGCGWARGLAKDGWRWPGGGAAFSAWWRLTCRSLCPRASRQPIDYGHDEKR
jgi:hypothetical protein